MSKRVQTVQCFIGNHSMNHFHIYICILIIWHIRFLRILLRMDHPAIFASVLMIMSAIEHQIIITSKSILYPTATVKFINFIKTGQARRGGGRLGKGLSQSLSQSLSLGLGLGVSFCLLSYNTALEPKNFSTSFTV